MSGKRYAESGKLVFPIQAQIHQRSWLSADRFLLTASLSLRELWGAARALESRLLPLLYACIAPEESLPLDLGTELRIEEEERTANAMAHGIGLRGLPTPNEEYFQIELVLLAYESKRCQGILNLHTGKIVFDLLSVHMRHTLTIHKKPHTRDGCFALPHAVEVLPLAVCFCHRIYGRESVTGFCAS